MVGTGCPCPWLAAPGSVQLKTNSDVDVILNLPRVGQGLGIYWGLWSQAAQVQVPVPSLPSWVTLGKWLDCSEPQRPQVRKETVVTVRNSQGVVNLECDDA